MPRRDAAGRGCFRKCLDKSSEFSAQRLAGLTGWFFVIIFLMISTLWSFDLPRSFELFMAVSAALLGLDSVAETVSAWKGSGNLPDLENPFTGDSLPETAAKIEETLEKAIQNDSRKIDIVTEGNSAYINPYSAVKK